MILIDYHCFACGENIEDVDYESYVYVRDKIKCKCGKMAHRKWDCQIVIDDWSPMTNDAQRDIEHFEKMKARGKTTRYHEDRTKQNIPMNIEEV